MDDLANLDLMHQEWEAWQRVVKEWGHLDLGDFNDPKFEPFIRAIQHWGEWLVALRLTQSEEIRQEALRDYAKQYGRIMTH